MWSGNDCDAVHEFIKNDGVSLLQLITGQEIYFSNSMVEAVNKVMKYRYHFHQDLADINAVEKYLQAAVPNYNCIRPHYSLKGHTPQQVLKGECMKNTAWKAQMKISRLKRLEENQKAACGVVRLNSVRRMMAFLYYS